jgi:hypothetical protein
MITEIVFRITTNQLRIVTQTLEDNGPESVVLAKCGKAQADLTPDCKRLVWCFNKKIECFTYSVANEKLATLKFENEFYCIIANNIEILKRVAINSRHILWAFSENDNVKVFIKENDSLNFVAISMIIGHDLRILCDGKNPMLLESNLADVFFQRTRQAFGEGTVHFLSHLTVAVVGVSGTGSIVAEQLYRLGIKRIILVDDDIVEYRNLNRIINSTMEDAKIEKKKVFVLRDAYQRIGLPTEIISIPTLIKEAETIHLLSACDIIFGCLDSVEGRMHLNRINTYYSIPYFDLGVTLKSNNGSIQDISGSIRYVMPGDSSLLSRGDITPEMLRSETMRRKYPGQYESELKEGYIKGSNENSPAVISVNMFVSSIGVLDFLSRIHPYRDDDVQNDKIETIRVSIVGLRFSLDEPKDPDQELSRHLGEGDSMPLLGIIL